MRFETSKDIDREQKAITTFCNAYKLDYKKLNEWDVDFKLLKNNSLITYAEVKGRLKNAADAFPLPLAIRKVYKLCKKTPDPVIIWSCYDGILYAKLKSLKGYIRQGGRKPREGSANDIELMAYYDNQETIRFLKWD